MDSEEYNRLMLIMLDGLTVDQLVVRLLLIVHLLLDAGGEEAVDRFYRYLSEVIEERN